MNVCVCVCVNRINTGLYNKALKIQQIVHTHDIENYS